MADDVSNSLLSAATKAKLATAKLFNSNAIKSYRVGDLAKGS